MRSLTNRVAFPIIQAASKEVTGWIPAKGALLYPAVGHFPVKGGEADGRRAEGESPPLPDMLSHRPCDDDLHIPRSSLTARLSPERST